MAPLQELDSQARRALSEIKLEDIDFEKVKECNDKLVLKRYIKLIEDDGSYFVDLLKACKDKLLEVAPKEYYKLYPSVATAEEVGDATRDLLDWEESVKETDAALRKSKQDRIWDDIAKVSAPIRGQEPVVARPSPASVTDRGEQAKRTGQSGQTKKERLVRDGTNMKDYYSAWDNVDVEAIEQSMDDEEREQEESRRRHFDDLKNLQDDAQATTPINVDSLPDSIPLAHRRHMADSEKEKGNEAFYAKDYEEAEAYYSRSIHFAADDPSTWANRALIRLKLQRPEEALEDCTHALALNPQYMKALHRKGKALYELQRYEESVRYFQRALAESPQNTQINGDLMVARRRLRTEGPSDLGQHTSSRSVSESPSCKIEELDDENEVAPVKPPPAGYTRVMIEEDSDSESGEDQATAPSKTVDARGNFHKVVIEEVEESEEEDAPQSVAPALSPAATSLSQGTGQKQPAEVVIVEVEESEEEDAPQSVAPALSPAATSLSQGTGQKQPAEAVSASPKNTSPTKTAGAPPPGSTDARSFRRVVIEEDDGSDDEVQPAATVAAPQSNASQPPGGLPVHSAQQNVGTTTAEVGSGTGNSKSSDTRGNFTRIVIEEGDSSEDEGHTPVAPATTASAVVAPPPTSAPPPAAAVEAGLCFDDMD